MDDALEETAAESTTIDSNTVTELSCQSAAARTPRLARNASQVGDLAAGLADVERILGATARGH